MKETDHRRGRVVLSSTGERFEGTTRTEPLLTIHLQDVGLEQLLVAGGVAGVVAHVDGGHLGDVERVVLSEVLRGARKAARLASLPSGLGRTGRTPRSPGNGKAAAWRLPPRPQARGWAGSGCRTCIAAPCRLPRAI